MQGELYTIYHLTIDPADYEAFKALATRIVEDTRREPDTLAYEWLVSDDRSQAHILERYRMAGLLPHVEQTFAPHAEEFLSLARIDKLFVYGDPTPDIRAKLDSFGAIYLAPFAGFTR
jgi:quinol monooxygenase YgiN